MSKYTPDWHANKVNFVFGVTNEVLNLQMGKHGKMSFSCDKKIIIKPSTVWGLFMSIHLKLKHTKCTLTYTHMIVGKKQRET